MGLPLMCTQRVYGLAVKFWNPRTSNGGGIVGSGEMIYLRDMKGISGIPGGLIAYSSRVSGNTSPQWPSQRISQSSP